MLTIGIFLAGPSREREIAFAGGRTVYDNLNKQLFRPIPIFVDSFGQLCLLDWEYLYKGSIRDFYPPVQALPPSPHHFQIYVESLGLSKQASKELLGQIGRPISFSELPELIDFAFLSLHGEWGEDGQLQGMLEALGIPYSGSGIRASSLGMDKSFQKKMMQAGGFESPPIQQIWAKDWSGQLPNMEQLKKEMGFPLVVRPSNQGSSIGVSIVDQPEDLIAALEDAFFGLEISAQDWQQMNREEQIQWMRKLLDIRSGLGFPLEVQGPKKDKQLLYHPEQLLALLDKELGQGHSPKLHLQSQYREESVLLEGFIEGREFSCVVIQDEDGQPIALPPTEIIKGKELFDYRSKYLAGLSRKLTPIDLPEEQIQAIRQECERLFRFLEFDVYARIDGFIQADGRIILNDPNTTSGMLPSSFFFHQAAEIGLNPSHFLSFIIHRSLLARSRKCLRPNNYGQLLAQLESEMQRLEGEVSELQKVAVILGGYSSERHISVESGRNIYEKLASSANYLPFPVFLTGKADDQQLYELPINLLLKDNADDIRDKLLNYKVHPIIQQIRQETAHIAQQFSGRSSRLDPRPLSFDALAEETRLAFIALHGRPGEDGALQRELAQRGIAFNGSEADSAALTIDKYQSLQKLKAAGLPVTEQILLSKSDYLAQTQACLKEAGEKLGWPLIAKPVDDGCSSAVKKIKNEAELEAFLAALFREEEALPQIAQDRLAILPKEEFPQKEYALLEQLVEQKDALHFLEVTVGLLCHHEADGSIRYEVFEPSETLASGEILSLEEKFLAGEGQNITPARLAVGELEYAPLAAQIKADLEQAARILGVTGYARIDAFVRIYADGRAETLVIEVNSLPGMTPATCIFHQTAINGYQPFDFIRHILTFGQEREAQKQLQHSNKEN
ncbi:D-alanine--D-alanine ligase [Saprospira sp. CCB-QB6]|uniref:D-alanine--D-alanine ligase family protein n=1 Tax=Saprospira sp. CCB-QB6 TaxID=3023936 RepID=UPI002349845F|nr:D-alanine--D-alanine ligase [Saprospira sp. CCB-QB6]WCL82257.1 D-alanine--D-alanine ligase [Saprospira sp. CCB-QB6]